MPTCTVAAAMLACSAVSQPPTSVRRFIPRKIKLDVHFRHSIHPSIHPSIHIEDSSTVTPTIDLLALV